MTRNHTRKEITRSVVEYDTEYKCDICGKDLDSDGIDDMFPNELMILLNIEECVSQKFRRDLCVDCLEPIWAKICEAISADPDDISGSDFEED
jgi:hypothetical protein